MAEADHSRAHHRNLIDRYVTEDAPRTEPDILARNHIASYVPRPTSTPTQNDVIDSSAHSAIQLTQTGTSHLIASTPYQNDVIGAAALPRCRQRSADVMAAVERLTFHQSTDRRRVARAN